MSLAVCGAMATVGATGDGGGDRGGGEGSFAKSSAGAGEIAIFTIAPTKARQITKPRLVAIQQCFVVMVIPG